MCRNVVLFVVATLAFGDLVLLPGCRHAKYKNPVTKDIRKPGRTLSDRAVDDIENSRLERARLMRNTLMNTYGGSENDLATVEAEYKDFILFSPSQVVDTRN